MTLAATIPLRVSPAPATSRRKGAPPMSSVRSLRQRDPYKLDAVVRYAGAGYRRSAAVDKHLAAAEELSRSRANRLRNGDDPHSPAARALAEAVVLLAEHPSTSPWPILTEARIVVIQARIKDASDDVLRARLTKLDEDEIDALADLGRARMGKGCVRAARTYLLDILSEQQSIADELDERERRGR